MYFFLSAKIRVRVRVLGSGVGQVARGLPGTYMNYSWHWDVKIFFSEFCFLFILKLTDAPKCKKLSSV